MVPVPSSPDVLAMVEVSSRVLMYACASGWDSFMRSTASRLARPVDPSYYDASLALRNLIRRLATLPVFGALSRAVLRKLVMLETIAVKR